MSVLHSFQLHLHEEDIHALIKLGVAASRISEVVATHPKSVEDIPTRPRFTTTFSRPKRDTLLVTGRQRTRTRACMWIYMYMYNYSLRLLAVDEFVCFMYVFQTLGTLTQVSYMYIKWCTYAWRNGDSMAFNTAYSFLIPENACLLVSFIIHVRVHIPTSSVQTETVPHVRERDWCKSGG